MAKEQEIKSMKLYHHLDRIERRLKYAGVQVSLSQANGNCEAENRLLDPELLATMDCLHYCGDEPLQRVQLLLQEHDADLATGTSTVSTGTRVQDKCVLDVGTGYGGTARLLAARVGCAVDALELQPDMSAAASELTRLCGLDGLVRHITGDFLALPVVPGKYDAVVALLCFLHIGKWPQLFQRCWDSLKPGGVMYIEDFFRRGAHFTEEELAILKQDIHCAELCTKAQLITTLKDCGFDSVNFEDVTEKWVPFVTKRAEMYATKLDEHRAQDGDEAAAALNHFYQSVAHVFSGGHLGGYILTVQKPFQASQDVV